MGQGKVGKGKGGWAKVHRRLLDTLTAKDFDGVGLTIFAPQASDVWVVISHSRGSSESSRSRV